MKLLEQLGLDAIIGIDFETFYSTEYSLKRMSTTEYIVDPRFEMQMAAVRWHTDRKATVYNPTDFKRLCKEIDWKRTGMLAHHAQFDGFILSHHFGVKPRFYLDTLSMARAIMPVHVGHSLKAVTEAFGRKGKRRAQALVNVKGRRLADFTPREMHELKAYAGDDINDTWFIFRKLLPYLPTTELQLIDLTVKMYAQPTIHINRALVQDVHDDAVAGKQALLKRLKLTATQLSSNQQFADLLTAAGVDVPTKISPKGKLTLALSKQDEEFKALTKHKSKKVRDLVEARLAIKSTLAETRSKKMVTRSVLGAQPVYLKYAGAKTFRWSGGDAMNYQNFTRGSDMRAAIVAPPGHTFVIADQSQIEARLNAWFAKQDDVVAAFAAKRDVYKIAASRTYNKPVDQITKDERFVGKVQVLALGYQAGGARFAEMLRLGQFGPPMDITDEQASAWVAAWRAANHMIVANWRATQNMVKSAFIGRQRIEHGCVAYEGIGNTGYMHLPGGISIRYDMLEPGDSGDLSYVTRYKSGRDGPTIQRQHLYGGLLVENRTQALARQILAGQMVTITQRLPYARVAMTTHDEMVVVVPVAKADRAHRTVVDIMTTPPDWAEGLPFGVSSAINTIYVKPD